MRQAANRYRYAFRGVTDGGSMVTSRNGLWSNYRKFIIVSLCTNYYVLLDPAAMERMSPD